MRKKIVFRRVMIFTLAGFLCGQFLLPLTEVKAISDEQKKAISEHCEEIRSNLGSTQRADAKARVYLGRYYETIITKFVTPLNVRLVSNNQSTADLVENQNDLAKAREDFTEDYVSYQKELEELVAIECETEPEKFYEKLVEVRSSRKTVETEVTKIRTLITEHMKLVRNLMEEL